MTDAGVAFSRFLEVDSNTGLIIAAIVVLFYAVFGGMKGITYTQVAQYCVLMVFYIIPAIFISLNLTGNPIPQLGMFGNDVSTGMPTLQKLICWLLTLALLSIPLMCQISLICSY